MLKFSGLLSLFLCFGFAQSASGGAFDHQEDISGVWRHTGEYLILEAGGGLYLPDTTEYSGLFWKTDGNALILKNIRNDDGSVTERRFGIDKVGIGHAELVNADGSPVHMQREDSAAAPISLSVHYLERMALPSHITILTTLWSSGVAVSVERRDLPGQTPLNFRIWALKKPVPDAITVQILHGDNALFATPEPVAIQFPTPEQVKIRLQRVVEEQTRLEGTRWNLQSLNGQPIQIYSDQIVPFFQLDRDMSTVNGSDGCNNFFMTAKVRNQQIQFSNGGSTMKLCQEGHAQQQAVRSAFHQADSWKIENSTLTLLSGGKAVAVFRKP